jgi:hypothetical protein
MEKGKREMKRNMGEATRLDGEGEEGDAAWSWGWLRPRGRWEKRAVERPREFVVWMRMR